MMLGRHYHVAPSCLLRQLNQTAGTHSPQVGWMADGFPLYGPLGPTGEAMRRCHCSIDLLGSMVVGVYDLRASNIGPVGCQK